jgi:hypothetical protein
LSWTHWLGLSIGSSLAAAGGLVYRHRPGLAPYARIGLASFLLLAGLSLLVSSLGKLAADTLLERARGFYEFTTLSSSLLAFAAATNLLWTACWWPTTPPRLLRITSWSTATASLAVLVLVSLNPHLLVKRIIIDQDTLHPERGILAWAFTQASHLWMPLAAGGILLWRFRRAPHRELTTLAWLSVAAVTPLLIHAADTLQSESPDYAWPMILLAVLYVIGLAWSLLARQLDLPFPPLAIGFQASIVLSLLAFIVTLLSNGILLPAWEAPSLLVFLFFALLAVRAASSDLGPDPDPIALFVTSPKNGGLP